MRLDRKFFAREAAEVAQDLIGAILVRHVNDRELRARIVETEAYIGPHDLACHASKGRTKRTEIMFGQAGHAYIYLCYGIHHLLNIVTGKTGDPQAVLLRAAEPINFNANLTGPGNLTKALQITTADNGADLAPKYASLTPKHAIFFEKKTKKVTKIATSKRIGVDYAGDWKHALLRFTDAQSPAVSGRKSTRRSKAATKPRRHEGHEDPRRKN